MHVFISYAQKDALSSALVICSRLESITGITAWMDKKAKNDKSLMLQIEDQINQCDYLIVLLSPDIHRQETNIQSESFVRKEIAFAQQTQKPIIPLMIKKTIVPAAIVTLAYIDCTKDFESGISQLIQQLTGVMPAINPRPKAKPRENSTFPIRPIPLLLIVIVVALILGLWQFRQQSIISSENTQTSVFNLAVGQTQTVVYNLAVSQTLSADPSAIKVSPSWTPTLSVIFTETNIVTSSPEATLGTNDINKIMQVSVDFVWVRVTPDADILATSAPKLLNGASVTIIGKAIYEDDHNQWWLNIQTQNNSKGWIEQQSLVEVTPIPTIPNPPTQQLLPDTLQPAPTITNTFDGSGGDGPDNCLHGDLCDTGIPSTNNQTTSCLHGDFCNVPTLPPESSTSCPHGDLCDPP